MTNEALIEALDYGFKITNTLLFEKNVNYVSCSGFTCDSCKYNRGRLSCKIGYDEITKEQYEFIKEKYPEYLLC